MCAKRVCPMFSTWRGEAVGGERGRESVCGALVVVGWMWAAGWA